MPPAALFSVKKCCRLSESNYDKGMNAGVEAIVDILSHPDAKKEMSAVQPAAYHASSDLEELDLAELLIFSFFCFFLVCLRVLRALVRSFNSTKSQIDAVIRKKRPCLDAFLIYLIIPCSAAAFLGITDFLQLLTIGMGGFILLWYAYIGFTIWDSRRRRMLVFEGFVRSSSQPKKYMLLRSVTRFYWVDALFFPLPFLWFWYKKNKQLSASRDHPRVSADGHLLFKVADDQKAAFLNPHQKVEESLKTVEYDIWRSDIFDVTEAVGTNLYRKAGTRVAKNVIPRQLLS